MAEIEVNYQKTSQVFKIVYYNEGMLQTVAL